ncbi:unnamed protein product [Fraxinus pennsylvanica]|uniref:BZIP domain-containing protein n=1 Tax=Fraxinus pennsylvanica TaxID=56036 RepID=A0AAD2A4P5_9LAMI|nr:unnamed protein product [Fraxinus pennsylvanica]
MGSKSPGGKGGERRQRLQVNLVINSQNLRMKPSYSTLQPSSIPVRGNNGKDPISETWDGTFKFGILSQWSTPGRPRATRKTFSLDEAIEHELKSGRKIDRDMDPMKLRRIISNKLSAQRTRMRILEYIQALEEMVNRNQAMISHLKRQVESCKNGNKMLVMHKENLQRQFKFFENESKRGQVEHEAMKHELQHLKEISKDMQLGFCQYGNVQQLPFDPLYQQQCPSTSGHVQSSHTNLQGYSAAPSGRNYLWSSNINGSCQQSTSELNIELADTDQYLNFDALNADPSKVTQNLRMEPSCSAMQTNLMPVNGNSGEDLISETWDGTFKFGILSQWSTTRRPQLNMHSNLAIK